MAPLLSLLPSMISNSEQPAPGLSIILFWKLELNPNESK